MNTITISKALNVKNKLVNEINALRDAICSNNSFVVGSNSKAEKTDVVSLLSEMWAKTNKLIELKAKIQAANAGKTTSNVEDSPFQAMVVIEESKSLISWLEQLKTSYTHYPETVRSNRRVVGDKELFDIVSYDSHIHEDEIDKRIKGVQDNMEKSFDMLTAFNATTRIDFEV